MIWLLSLKTKAVPVGGGGVIKGCVYMFTFNSHVGIHNVHIIFQGIRLSERWLAGVTAKAPVV